MVRITRKLEKFKIPFIVFTILFIFCALNCQSLLNTPRNSVIPQANPTNLRTCQTYESGTYIFTNQTINENILILSQANVTLINSTVHGSIYVFNFGRLYLLQNSNVTEDLDISDSSTVKIENSTVLRSIKCRDSSVLEMFNTKSAITTITKLNSADVTITNSSIASLNEFYGTGGKILILNSNINLVSLLGPPYPIPSLSQTFINKSNILSLVDKVTPFNIITGPVRFNYLTGNFSYSTSERKLNVTWRSYDSPIINGYLNLTFRILVDGAFYAPMINGSGFINQYVGYREITFNQTGKHNISVIAIDSKGNNFTSTITIEIIEYPSFSWLSFWIIVITTAIIAFAAMSVLQYKQKKGYHSALGAIFKKEFAENKLKIILFIAIAAVPGLIIFFIFNTIARMVGSISIDGIRSLSSTIFTLFLYYFALFFSITFGAGAVVNVRKSGALSWFLSKPIRRWEFLWGKILAYLVIIIIIMISSSVAFVLGGFSFIDPLYYPDILSMGGYIFLIGLATLIPLTAIVVLFSSVLKKPGMTIFIPILLLLILPPLTSFLPILTRNEWPLLLSFSYYSEMLGNAWVYQGGGLFSSIGTSFGSLFGINITPLTISSLQIIIVLSAITIICLILATIYLERKDVA